MLWEANMKKFLIAISTVAAMLAGCGGSGSQADTVDAVPTLQVSPNILKIGYLPTYGMDGTFEIIDMPEDANITLLDAQSGRYSYLTHTTLDSSDRFIYEIIDNNTTKLKVAVDVNVLDIPVMTNDGSQEDFNTSSPIMIEGKELVNFSSNLPVMVIDIGDQEIPDEPKVPGTLTLFEPGENNRTDLGSLPTHVGYMEIERRGSSSQYYYPKKQYGMDTILWDGEDDDISLLGMPKEHKWILQAPYGDKSLMRNYLAYHKTREIDETKYYAVRSRYIELLTRVGSQYRYDGVYVLMEKIKRDGDRLDIAKLTDEDVLPPEITGGYILKQDGEPDPDEYSFLTTRGTTIIVYYPGDEDLNSDQKYYIENYVQEFEFALNADDFNNSTSMNYYGNWIEEESFIVHLLSRELFMDIDTWMYSEYFYKDREKNLAMTPVWDFNAGMGNNNYLYEGRTDGWAFTLLKDEGFGGYSLRYWMERLMSDSVFRQHVRTKWQELRGSIWSDVNLSNFIATTQDTLTESAGRNFERWPNVLGVYVWPNRKACKDGGQDIYCPTFDRAVNEHLKSWLLQRAAWIDSQLQ